MSRTTKTITQIVGPRVSRLTSMPCVYLEPVRPRPSCSCSMGRRYTDAHRSPGGDPAIDLGAALSSSYRWNGPERSGVPALTSRCGVDVSGEGTHHSQIAILLGVIEAVADHELVRYVEPDVPDLEIYLHGFRFAQQGAHLHRGRSARTQVGHQPGQREAGIDDVLDDQNVPATDVPVQVLEDAHDTGRLGAGPVGRHRHPVGLDAAG